MSDFDQLQAYQRTLLCFDTPAYLQRAQSVEAEWNSVLARCRRQRREWLLGVGIHIGRLHQLMDGDWSHFDVFTTGRVADLQTILEICQPDLKTKTAPANHPGQLTRTVQELRQCVGRFNARWQDYVQQVDLTEVNRQRQGYNDYYVLEKECVVLSASVARAGFTPLAPATRTDVMTALPLLPNIAG